MSDSLKTLVLCIYMIAALLFVSWLTITHFGPPDAAATVPPVAEARSQCLVLMPGGYFLPCKEVEPSLYPNEWLALSHEI